MVLDMYKARVLHWRLRLFQTRKKSKDICRITGFTPAKVSLLINTPPDNVGKMRLCDFSAIEGAILQLEQD